MPNNQKEDIKKKDAAIKSLLTAESDKKKKEKENASLAGKMQEINHYLHYRRSVVGAQAKADMMAKRLGLSAKDKAELEKLI